MIEVSRDALVVLVGPSGSGKSTFAARHFADEEVLSSDAFRQRILGDVRDQSGTDEIFRQLHAALEARLRAGRLTVVDATNVVAWDRQALRRRGMGGRPLRSSSTCPWNRASHPTQRGPVAWCRPPWCGASGGRCAGRYRTLPPKASTRSTG
ncbi:hypothetical protein BH20CHL6_BH20CHL6_21030 [soil metagenome]